MLSTTASYLQQKLPLSNQLLRPLGCLNPAKRKGSTISVIQSLTGALELKLNKAEVVDEWKVFQVDNDLSPYDPKERREVFWKKVFKLQ